MYYFFVFTSYDVLVYDKITFTLKCNNRHVQYINDSMQNVL